MHTMRLSSHSYWKPAAVMTTEELGHGMIEFM
jgi:hypothetical protein